MGWGMEKKTIIFFGIIAAIVMGPLSSRWLLPYVVDIVNHVSSIEQAQTALREGQFPLRIAPLEGHGWRYPYFQFYSPTSYMIGALLNSFVFMQKTYITFKFMMWAALTCAGWGFYRLVYWLFDQREIALVSGVAYLFSPYIILCVNHLAAFNEVLALSLMPLLIWNLLRCYTDPTRIGSWLASSVLWYLLATIHGITFFDATCFVFLLLLFGSVFSFSRWTNLMVAASTWIWGCAMAAWFIVPVSIVKPYMQFGNALFLITADFFQPSFANLVSPSANFTAGFVYKKYVNTMTQLHPALGIHFIIGAIVCVYACYLGKRENRTRFDFWFLPTLVLFAFLFFIVWSPINVWDLLAPLKLNQYSWRLLGQLIWMAGLLFAFALYFMFQGKMDMPGVVILVVVIMLMSSVWQPLIEKNSWLTEQEITQHHKEITNDMYYISPKVYLHFIKPTPAEKILTVDEMKKHCHLVTQDTVCEVTVGKDVKRLELPMYFYPGMLDIRINHKPASYLASLSGDRLLASVVPEAGQLNHITARFVGIQWANDLSLFAWAVWLVGVVFWMAGRKTWERAY